MIKQIKYNNNNPFTMCTKNSAVIVFFLLLIAACRNVESFHSSSPLTKIGQNFNHRHQAAAVLIKTTKISLQQQQQRLLRLDAKKDDGEDEVSINTPKEIIVVDPIVKETALRLRRLSWGAWWAQLILTVVSSITLLFAKNVIQLSSNNNPSMAMAATTSNNLPNFLLAGTGIIISIVSIFWTWASRRLSRRLLKKYTSRIQAATMLRKAITVGVTLNIFGMFFCIMGAEQIVGVLAIKVLTTSSRSISLVGAEATSMMLQPLDILVVQANTNTLFSHFCSIVALLYMSRSILKLDPPSIEVDERN